LLTGLPWTGIWGEKFADVWNRYPVNLWTNVPESKPVARTLNSTLDKTVPWAVEPAPLPSSDAHAHHGGGGQDRPVAPSLTLTQAEALATQWALPAPYTIALPQDEKGVYTIATQPDDPALQHTYYVDQYSGKILVQVGYADYGWVPKAVEYGISLHEGKFFGLANQLLMLTVCLMLVLTCVSGVVMWWKRRPQGGLGAPKTPLSLWRWKPALLVLIALALVLPTVLASLLVVFILDRLFFKRMSDAKGISS
jgi:uncharacterized iron-regulated membrane protein